MTSNPQITRDLLDHVSSQLGPDSMHPFVSVDLRPNRWPSEEQWAKFGAFTVKERAEVLRAAFTESAIAVYVQQLINTTRSNGFYNTTFYFVQDHLFELLHSQSGQSGGSMDEATTKKSKAKKKQDRDKERDKMLVINKIKRYEWPQDQCAAEWLLNRVVFPARNGVDVCEFTCASESYQDVKMLQEVVTHLGYYECKTFDVMRTVPQEVRRAQSGRTAGQSAPVMKVATVMAISLSGFLAMRLAACVHDICTEHPRKSSVANEIGRCLSIYADITSREDTFSSAFLNRCWKNLSLVDRIHLLHRVFPETTHPGRRAKAALVEAITNNPSIDLSIPDYEQPASAYPPLLSSIAAIDNLGAYVCEFVCYVRLTEYHTDGWCKWAEEGTNVLQDLWMQHNADQLLADSGLDAAVDSGLTQPSRSKKKKKKAKRKARATNVGTPQPSAAPSRVTHEVPPGSDSDSCGDRDPDGEENDVDRNQHVDSQPSEQHSEHSVPTLPMSSPQPTTVATPVRAELVADDVDIELEAVHYSTATEGIESAAANGLDSTEIVKLEIPTAAADVVLDQSDAQIQPVTPEDDNEGNGEGEHDSCDALGVDIVVCDSPRSIDPQPSISRSESPLLTEAIAGASEQPTTGDDAQHEPPSVVSATNDEDSPRKSDTDIENASPEVVSDADEDRDTLDTQQRDSDALAVPPARGSNATAFQQILLRRMGSESSIASSEETRSPQPSLRLSARGAQLLRTAIPGVGGCFGPPRSMSESLLKGQLTNNSDHMQAGDATVDLIATAKFQELCDRLTDDVEDMARHLNRIAVIRRPWQLAAIERVRAIIASLWPHSTVELYGSFATGLAIPASDVDLVVCGMHEMLQWWGGKAVSAVAILADSLRSAEWVSTVQAVEQTAVPVVKVSIAPVPTSFGDRRGIIRMDISFDVNTGTILHGHTNAQGQGHGHNHATMHQGLQARDFTLRLCAMNPMLTPLVLVLKQFLLENGLHDAYMGGLPSHALTVMIASVLQRHALEPPEQQPDLGTLLLAFFMQFGTSFDTRKHMVCLSPSGPLVTLSPLHSPHVPRVGTPEWWRPADPVVIQDPLQPNNNIGRACFGFRQLQLHFDRALQSLLKFGDESTNMYDSGTSALGALFSTGHHQSVVQLTAQVWCPKEQAVSAAPIPVQRHTSSTGDEERLQKCTEMLKLLSHDGLKRFEDLLKEEVAADTVQKDHSERK